MFFYVDKINLNPNYSGSSDYTYPCFVLLCDNWDDYGYKTLFNLYYFEDEHKFDNVGFIKIISKQFNDERIHWAKDCLPNYFEKLNYDYCSLGQDEDFYRNMLRILGKDNAYQILERIRDCSINSSIIADYETERYFSSSLIRSNFAEKMLRMGRQIINESNIDTFFNLNFDFRPPYNDEQVLNISFNFENISEYYSRRIYCLIGENGVGKTQILSSFLKSGDNYKKQFGKIIYISNNYYERTNFDKKNDFIVNCSLIENNENGIHIISEETQKEIIKNNLKKIIRKYSNTSEQNYINKFLEGVSELFPNVDFSELELFTEKCEFNRFLNSFSILSSGESALLYSLINMISNIRFNSLLLFDEPEVHLHPNFITKFMEFLYKLLEQFDSFAIICTHSAFIAREIKAESIYVLNRINNNCSVKRIKYESLGASAMTLANDIFENIEVQPFFKKEITKMVNNGLSEEEIVKYMKSYEDMDLDIGIKSLIHYLVSKRNEEN